MVSCCNVVRNSLSCNIPLPKSIIVHGMITDKDGIKMSKSLGNVIDPMELLNSLY